MATMSNEFLVLVRIFPCVHLPRWLAKTTHGHGAEFVCAIVFISIFESKILSNSLHLDQRIVYHGQYPTLANPRNAYVMPDVTNPQLWRRSRVGSRT